MRVAFSVSTLVATAAGVAIQKVPDTSFISNKLEFETKLRICNAYPYAKDSQVQVFDLDIPYKQCQEMHKHVREGDQIDFFTMGKKILVGSFEIQEVPQQDSLMLLVIQPHDSTSTGVAFQSHAFANTADAQVALLDGSVGEKRDSLVEIRDDLPVTSRYKSRTEKLRFNSVVAIHPGFYKVGTNKVAMHQLSAEPQEKYSVVRVGVKGAENEAQFPEDIIVFPSSNAAAMSVSSLLVAALFWSFF